MDGSTVDQLYFAAIVLVVLVLVYFTFRRYFNAEWFGSTDPVACRADQTIINNADGSFTCVDGMYRWAVWGAGKTLGQGVHDVFGWAPAPTAAKHAVKAGVPEKYVGAAVPALAYLEGYGLIPGLGFYADTDADVPVGDFAYLGGDGTPYVLPNPKMWSLAWSGVHRPGEDRNAAVFPKSSDPAPTDNEVLIFPGGEGGVDMGTPILYISGTSAFAPMVPKFFHDANIGTSALPSGTYFPVNNAVLTVDQYNAAEAKKQAYQDKINKINEMRAAQKKAEAEAKARAAKEKADAEARAAAQKQATIAQGQGAPAPTPPKKRKKMTFAEMEAQAKAEAAARK